MLLSQVMSPTCSISQKMMLASKGSSQTGTLPNSSTTPTHSSRGRIHFHPNTISSTDTFIQTRFHPMTLSSKHDFIQWHFHPKHFHPILTLSSNFDTFIQWHSQPRQFHPTTISSNEFLIQWHFHPMTFSTNNGFIQKKITCGTINIVRVSVKASLAEGRRRLHTNTAYAPPFGFQQAFRCLGV